MTIALLQISDIHFKKGTVLKKTDSIVSAIRGLNLANPTIIIIISGDCAFSGKFEEYSELEKYIIELKENIQQVFTIHPHIIISPGNHDIEFPDDSALRDLVINNLRQTSTLPSSIEIINTCINGQERFFEFLYKVTPPLSIDKEKLSWNYLLTNEEGTKIGVKVLNTAWMSTINEIQGSLFFPIDHIQKIPESDLRITVMHHPYNWFNATNAQKIRTQIELESDIVITGHEHEGSEYRIIRERKKQTEYIEGGIFNSENSGISEINIILIDIQKSRYSVIEYNWRGELYSKNNEVEWISFIFPQSQYSKIDRVTEETKRFLNYPGMQLTHRAKEILLKDIFVPPDLKVYEKLETPEKVKTDTISSMNTIDKLFEFKYTYILGENQSGKTSLGKMLFIKGIEFGKTPIYIEGMEINRFDEKHIERIINGKIKQQYLSLTEEEYWQLPVSDRSIIIDCFEQIKLNKRTKSLLADWLKQHFEYVFLFGGELTQIEELISNPDLDGTINRL